MKPTIYIAPQGYVYDYLIPRFDENGEQLHLYADKIAISRFDDINNYTLILNPKEKQL